MRSFIYYRTIFFWLLSKHFLYDKTCHYILPSYLPISYSFCPTFSSLLYSLPPITSFCFVFVLPGTRIWSHHLCHRPDEKWETHLLSCTNRPPSLSSATHDPYVPRPPVVLTPPYYSFRNRRFDMVVSQPLGHGQVRYCHGTSLWWTATTPCLHTDAVTVDTRILTSRSHWISLSEPQQSCKRKDLR